MLKVLHFYKTYYPYTLGGVEQVINQISESCTPYSIKSTVLSLAKNVDSPVSTVGTHEVFFSKTTFDFLSTPFSISAIKQFEKLAQNADIIHYHFPYPFADLLHFIAKVKKPTIVSYHSDIVKQKYALKLYSPLMYKFLDSVNCITVSSPNYAESSIVLKKYKDKLRVIPYGIAENNPENEDLLEFWKQKVGGKFFLFIGAFRYYKGLHVLIEAASSTNMPVVIVGGGGLEKKLKEKVEHLGLKNIFFVGMVNDADKAALLTLCYAIIFPSCLRSEAFGMTLVEGAMNSKPLISCEIGTGTSYINIHESTGLTVPPFDPVALRKAMIYLWENPTVANKFGENAFLRYKELFTADIMAKKMADLYHEVASKGME